MGASCPSAHLPYSVLLKTTPRLPPVFMMYDQSAKSAPQNLPMNFGGFGESDEGERRNSGFARAQVAKTSKRGNNQQCLDRWQRALCRVLVQHHGVPRIILRDHFGCAGSTISKAVDNHYAQPDRTENDDEILSSETNFDAILRESSPECKPDLARLAALGSPRNPSTSKAPSLSPLVTAHCATSSPGSFLKRFVAEVPLDEGWYEKLKNAGFDEDKLRRFAGLRTDKIDKIIEKNFPEMTAVARFLLVMAIEGLAIQL
ncbi:hypothetical protein B0H13DRAFT_2324483 [Mycena leptocephala]|nr:hypothetical protein B0H13DRAFT_2324483 [Mycena leptocephala]